MKILVANLGSTSFKYRLFDLPSEAQLARGGIDRIGQAEVYTGESPILLNVRKKDGPDMEKGQEAVVLERDPDKNIYIIKPLNL